MKRFVSGILISLLLSSSVIAADTPVAPFVVNPKTLRTQLFSKNISLREALNNVENSKLNVSMARAKLLPSINLTMLLPALANPTFLLSQISFLFPFLLPSNWAVLKQSKELFESDKIAYKVTELNMLSSSLSLYYTYLNDAKVKQAYVEQSAVLEQIYKLLKRESDILGNISVEDLSMAEAQWNEAKIRVSKLDELLVAERAGIRTLLGLPLGADLKIEDAELAPSKFENKSATEVSSHSLEVAPEVAQLNLVLKAGQAGKFAKVFGFMSSATISGTATSNSTSVFDSLKAGGSFTFGMDNVVNVKIANNNIEAVKLRQEQLKEENEKVAEVVIGQMEEVKEQQDLYMMALNERISVYNNQKRRYDMGMISLQTLLQTQSQLTDSKVGMLKADLDLKIQRLTLSRLVIDGDFSEVKGCLSKEDMPKIPMFGKKPTLDDICQQ